MAPGIEMNLATIQAATKNMDDHARVILKNGNVTQGTTFSNKISAWIHQASKSNTEIRTALRTALGKKYDQSIVSRVMPNDAREVNKPLTARKIKEIIAITDRLDKNIQGSMLSKAKDMHALASFRGGPENMTPDDVAMLLTQIANAKQEVVKISQQTHLLSGDMSPEELLNKQSEIDELDIKQLPSDARAKVSELRDLINGHMRLLNQHAKRVTIYEDIKGTNDSEKLSKEDLKDLFDTNFNRLDDKLEALIPRNLQSDPNKDAKLEMDQISYDFEQLLKNNPDIRLGFGSLSAMPNYFDEKICRSPEDMINSMLHKTNFSLQQKKVLQDRLEKILNTHVPNEKNVEFDENTPLGTGANATVFKGTFNGKPVVVKRMNDLRSHAENFIEEGVFQGMGEDDPNIPKIMGIFKGSTGLKTYYLVSELVRGKGLEKILSGTNGPRDTQSRAKAGIAMLSGAIRALESLHKRGVAHMDMKLENLILNEKTLESTIIDYGTAVFPDRGQKVKDCTITYASPEVLIEEKPHLGSDIFALGMMFYECVLGDEPDKLGCDKNYIASWAMMNIIKNNGRLGDFTELCWDKPGMDKMKDLINACWERDPNDRPTSTQLRQALDGETVTPSAPDKPGLKEDRLAVLDILKPESPLRQGGREVLASWMA